MNAEDPEAVVRAGKMALDYRYEFGANVVIDLIGYRKHGHSEVDDPTITQPLRYRRFRIARRFGKCTPSESASTRRRSCEKIAEEIWTRRRKKRCELEKNPPMRADAGVLGRVSRADAGSSDYEVETGVRDGRSLKTGRAARRPIPTGFHIHPKVKKLFEQRLEMAQGKRPLDYGMAEAIAFGSLLEQGTPVRLTGQDSRARDV